MLASPRQDSDPTSRSATRTIKIVTATLHSLLLAALRDQAQPSRWSRGQALKTVRPPMRLEDAQFVLAQDRCSTAQVAADTAQGRITSTPSHSTIGYRKSMASRTAAAICSALIRSESKV